MARIRISDDIWVEFRRLTGSHSISAALGKLVEREVIRLNRKRAERPFEVLQAVRDARAVADEFQALAERLERLEKVRDSEESQDWGHS